MQGGASATSARKYCYNDTESNCNTYGGLYQWHTAMGFAQSYDSKEAGSAIKKVHRGICPEGWHVPSETEWGTLKTWTDKANGGATGDEGKSLKSKASWNGTNAYGFNGLPAGMCTNGKAFSDVGGRGNWWTTKENGAGTAYGRRLDGSSDGLTQMPGPNKINGFSVRCVKN